MTTSLYICYFGIRQPLVQTQVIPYLLEVQKDGVKIVLLTFEPNFGRDWSAESIRDQKKALSQRGIEWHCLPYHKRFSALATAYDIFRGVVTVRRIIRQRKIDVLHGRVHVPTFIGALARRLSRRKPKLIFDIRGFFPEEYVDAGVWPANGLLFRAAKAVEGWLLKDTDGFVVLTEAARNILFPTAGAAGFDSIGRPVEVIPCCVDLDRFGVVTEDVRRHARAKLGINDNYVVVYVGSFGGWYGNNEIAEFYGELLKTRRDAFAMVITTSPVESVTSLLTAQGYDSTNLLVTGATPEEVPFYLQAADAAISFVKECYSKKATSPTKNAEYLSAGLPIVSGKGVGDVEPILKGYLVGVVLNDYSRASYSSAIQEIFDLKNVRKRCRMVAEQEFDLQSVGGARYRRLYRRLLQTEMNDNAVI